MTSRHELLEAASYLETHGCLPEGLATTAVRAVVDPLMPGDKAEIVVALQVAAAAETGSSAPVTAPTPPEVRESAPLADWERQLVWAASAVREVHQRDATEPYACDWCGQAWPCEAIRVWSV